MSTSPRRVASLLHGIAPDRQGNADVALSAEAWHQAQRALHRWCTRHAVATDLTGRTPATSRAHRRAQAMLSVAVARLAPMRRVALREAFRQALQMVAHVRGAAGEQALDEWRRARGDEPVERWLPRWRAWSALAAAARQAVPETPPPGAQEHGVTRIVAAFLISPSRTTRFPR